MKIKNNDTRWDRIKQDCKTRVCIDCGKRKDIKNFHFQKPPYQHKIKECSTPKRRNDCKKCHSQKSKKAYYNRCSKKERQKYMREYQKRYDGSLPLGQRVRL